MVAEQLEIPLFCESTTRTLTDLARMYGQQIHCVVSLSFCRATEGDDIINP